MDEQAQRVQSYIDALVEEKLKIQVFQRELPLCLDLVNKAIENYRQQLSGTTTTVCLHGGHSECSEETSTPGPVLEEFIPIKRLCSGSNDDDDAELDSGRRSSDVKGTPSSNDNKTKSDWLRSAQLWNQTTPDLPPKDDAPPKRVQVLQVTRSGGAFQPFNREQGTIVKTGYTSKQSLLTLDKLHSTIPAASTSSTAETVVRSGSKEEREPAQPNRKQRRNWSPELHHRFLQALQQLGGSHAGTPKQIRELMKVDGLTNDEVKSHLQKYRLHTRRPSSSSTVPAAGAQATQFVVVGGIWVPPAAAVPASAPSAAAPLPADSNQKTSPDDSEGRGSHSDNGEEEARCTLSHSPATSSSSHTTTESRRR
ncbi:hypothetical protein MLD38_037998 [Melastoma candidum]|uniref:Uncharacterized protein n=1 Tax=Melastoma candidum TaxID=119954 RepID=A0ACB9KY60_9MYRT|nr:hypothetical protein MLD38_037998 [Melastoma candidum]